MSFRFGKDLAILTLRFRTLITALLMTQAIAATLLGFSVHAAQMDTDSVKFSAQPDQCVALHQGRK